MKIVDFKNVVLGRASTQVAKTLLKGEDVIIVNCEKAVVKGTRSGALEKFERRYAWRTKGNPVKRGPKYSRLPDRIVTWTIMHMLPDEKPSGRKPLERLKVYIGVPKSMEGKTFERIQGAENMEPKKFLTIEQISAKMGLELKRPKVTK